MTSHRPTGRGLAGYQYHRSGPVTLHLGDAADVLAAMPDGSVDAVVTSPPFWSLRDYGTGAWAGGDAGCGHRLPARRRVDGAVCPRCGALWSDPQYGLEATVEQYVARLVGVFDQVRRVLSPTGTCWVNLGDSYAGGAKRAYDTAGGIAATRRLPSVRNGSPLPAKNLIGVPWRVAFALQSSGWWLRNAVIWAKSNPMPESVTDRLSATYELLFLLTASQRYHFDLDPIRLPLKRPEAADGSRVFGGARKGTAGGVGATARRRGGRYGGKYTAEHTVVEPGAGRGNLVPLGHAHTAAHPKGRNPGDVWTIATRPYRGSHVAPFPIGLAAVQLGRRYVGIDIAAGFHDEAIARLASHLPDPNHEGGAGG